MGGLIAVCASSPDESRAMLARATRQLRHRGSGGQSELFDETVAASVMWMPQQRGCMAQDGDFWVGVDGVFFGDESGDAAQFLLTKHRELGVRAFEGLRGLWSAIIVDRKTRRLVLARDHLGTRPLFYAIASRTFIAASTPATVALLHPGGVQPSRQALDEFLSGYPPRVPDQTMFANVVGVPAGSSVEIDLDAMEPRTTRWWSPASIARRQVPFTTACDEYDELLQRIVSDHLRVSEGRRVGTFLSGGLDSSTITKLVAKTASPAHSFSITYDDPSMDESAYIRAVIDSGGIDGVLRKVGPDDAVSVVDRIVRVLEEPLLGNDHIAQFFCFEEAQRHGTEVLLDGVGSDEVNGGYKSFDVYALRDFIASGQVHEAFLQARGMSSPWPFVFRVLLGSFAPPSIRARNRRARRAACGWLVQRAGTDAEIEPERSSDHSSLNRLLFDQVRVTNIPATVVRQERAAAIHGIDARCPYLDSRVIELLFSLPPETKVARGERKRLLREVGRRYLPPVITERRDKKGWAMGLDWLNLRKRSALLDEVAGAPMLADFGFVLPDKLRSFVGRFADGTHDDTGAIWRLYTAERWLRWIDSGCPPP